MYRDIDINVIYSKNAYDKYYKLTESDTASEVVSAPISWEFILFQIEARKILNAKNMERLLNMKEGN